MPAPVASIMHFIEKYGAILGIVCIAYLQTLFPSKTDFEKLSSKFNEIDKKISEISYLQQNITQQQVKLADIEVRLRQLELDIVKVKATISK